MADKKAELLRKGDLVIHCVDVEVIIILNLHKSNDSTILNDNLSVFGASRDFFNCKRSEN